MSSEYNYVACLFNEQVMSKLRPILYDIQWEIKIAEFLFSKNSEISPEDLIKLDNISLSVHLSKVLVENETNILIEKISKVKNLTKEKDITAIIKRIYEFYKINKVARIVKNNSDNIDKLITDISKIEVDISSPIKVTSLSSLTPSELMGDPNNYLVLPSRLKLITDNLYNRGYQLGEIINFSAAPGKGKSPLMLYEAQYLASLGYKVLWIAMGDLRELDIINRLSSVATETEYFKVISNPDKYFNMIKPISENIDIVTKPAGILTTKDIFSLSILKNYDLIVVDYDGQIKPENGNNDNMYAQGGKIYEDLAMIANYEEKRKVLFVGSQISKFYWNHEIVPEDAVGESAKKQHHVDTMITIGRSNSNIHCGYLNLAKARRGKDGIISPYMMTTSGNFKEITKDELALMKNYDGNKKYQQRQN